MLLLGYDFSRKKILKKIAFGILFILFSIAFMISASDTPYYNQFYSRLDIQALEWLNDPKTIFGMVFQEVKYWIILIPLGLIIWLLRKVLKRIFNIVYYEVTLKKTGIYLLFGGLIFLGIRGGNIVGAPLRCRDAFNGKDIFLNTMKLNPVYTLIKSYEQYVTNKNSKLELMNIDLSIKKIQQHNFISEKINQSPIARNITFNNDTIKKM